MAKPLDTHVVVATIEAGPGVRLRVPFGLPEYVGVDESPQQLARRLAAAWQTHLLDDGDATEFARRLTPVVVRREQLEVAVEASRPPWRFPAHLRTIDLLVAELTPTRWLGLLPALGIEGAAGSEEALRLVLLDSVRLEFARRGRLTDARRLAAVSRQQVVAVEAVPVSLQLRTPAEREALGRTDDGGPLRRAARRMAVPRVEPVGLDDELAQLSRALAGTPARSVLIVGPDGAGKSAVVHRYLHQCREAQRVLPWETVASRLLQALTEQGAWQGELAAMCAALRRSGDVLYVNHLHELFDIGQYEGNSLSIGDALRDPLERGDVLLLAEATEASLARLESHSGGIAALFDIVRIAPVPDARKREHLRAAISAHARASRREIAPEAVDLALSLQRRFFPYSGFPGRVLRFVDSLLGAQRHDAQAVVVVGRAEVLEAFCADSGIPRAIIDDRIVYDAKRASAWFGERVIGQPVAVARVVDLLAGVKSRMLRADRPLGTLFFAGPTGVGKTELAKCLAEWLFGSPQRLLRLDMSEYSDPGAVLRLTGDDRSGGASLASRIRQQPFSVVLFDEVEKAHPNFFDLLLQLLGEGRLTDSRGELSSFCSAIVIATSNIGADSHGAAPLGFASGTASSNDVAAHYAEAVERHFRPELFNRIDQVVPFAPLAASEQPRIAAGLVERLRGRGAMAEYDTQLKVNEDALALLGRSGYDPRYGARGMRRSIHALLTVPVADALNAAPTGAVAAIHVGHVARELTVEPHPSPVAQARDGPLRDSDALAAQRRRTMRLRTGPALLALENELSRRELHVAQHKLPSHAVPDAERHRDLLAIRDECRRLDRDTCASEAHSLVQATGAQGDAPTTPVLPLSALTDRYAALAPRILQLHDRALSRALLAVYGPAEPVRQLVDGYRQLAERRGDRHREYVVRLHDDRYLVDEAPLDARQASRQLVRVGTVLSLQGPCVQLYFDGEAGFHRFEPARSSKSGRADVCLAEIVGGRIQDLVVPQDVHRRAFFDKQRTRRQFNGASFTDSEYGCNVTGLAGEPFVSVLGERYQARLDEQLLGS